MKRAKEQPHRLGVAAVHVHDGMKRMFESRNSILILERLSTRCFLEVSFAVPFQYQSLTKNGD